MLALVLVLVVNPYLFLAGEAVRGVVTTVDWGVDVDLVGGVALTNFAAFAAGVLETAVALVIDDGLSFAARLFEARAVLAVVA